MAIIDIIFIILFVLAGVKGYLKGFILELFSFIAFFIGLLVAVKYTSALTDWLFKDSSYYQFFAIICFVGLFLSVVLIINLLANILKKAVNITFLGFLDSALGAIAGAVKWLIIISLLIWVFDSVGFSLPTSVTENSFIFPLVERSGPVFFEWLSRIAPFIKDAIDSIDHLNHGRESFT